MSETYISIGHAMAWFVGLPMLFIFAVASVVNRNNPAKKIKPAAWAMAGAVAVAALLGLPMEFCVCVASLIAGVLVAVGVLGRTAGGPAARILLGAVFIAAGAGMGFLGTTEMKLTLLPDRVTYSSFNKPYSTPRKGLRMTEITNRPSLTSNRAWGSWTTFSGRSMTHLYLDGFTWYWGPHGFILGDDVARRVAEWAGVTPNVQPMMSDEELEKMKQEIEQEHDGPKPLTGNATEKVKQ